MPASGAPIALQAALLMSPAAKPGSGTATGEIPTSAAAVAEPQAREPRKGTRGGKIWLTANGVCPAAGSFRGKDAA
jgi:hypothetical protein